MTEQDQDAAIGRLVSGATAAKRKRAALKSEAHKIGTMLEAAGQKLRQLDYVAAFGDGKESGYAINKPDVALTPYPPMEEVTKLLDDLRAVSRELRELRKLMKEAGVDLD